MTNGTGLRVALVGYGLGGAAFHAPLIETTPAMTLAGVVTRDAGRAAEVRRRYPACRILSGAEEIFAEPEAWDLVVVTTPNATHASLAAAAVEAGLACVVDKPVATDAATARALGEQARARGVALVPFHNRRWDGDFLTIVDLVSAGRLGDLHRVESRFERWRPTVADRPTWRDDPDPAAAGGVLHDLGPHLVDQALVLWGRPAAVYAELDIRRHGAGTIDDAFVALSWPDGRRAHLWASAVAANVGPRFRVLGSRAAYVKWGMDPQETALRSGAVPGGASWGAEPAESWGHLGDETVPTRPGAYPSFYSAMVACLRDGGDVPVAWEDAVTGLEVIAAAGRSAADHAVIAL